MSEELMDWKIAEETATDLIKARYDAIAELNIVSTELTEVSDMPIYKVEGSLKTTTEEISFSVQIDAKTGKVLGFRRERLADRFSLG